MRQIIITFLTFLTWGVDILAQNTYTAESNIQDFEKNILHWIRTADEAVVSKVQEGYIELMTNCDTASIRDITTKLTAEREVIKYDKAHLVFLDVCLAPLLMSIGEYTSAVDILTESYDNLKTLDDVDDANFYTMYYMLSQGYDGLGDYNTALHYAKQMLKCNIDHMDPSGPFTAHLQIAISELGLENYISAYKHIKKAYKSPDQDRLSTRYTINATYIEILTKLTEISIKNGRSDNVFAYYRELQQILSEYPNMDLSFAIDRDYIINLISSYSETTENRTEVQEFIHKILAIKMDEVLSFPEYQLTSSEYLVFYSKELGLEALKMNLYNVSGAFLEYSYTLAKSSDISNGIRYDVTQQYLYFKANYENEYYFVVNEYTNLINDALLKGDLETLETLLIDFLYYYDCTTYFLRYFYKEKDIENGVIEILTLDKAQEVLDIWTKISDKIITTYGKQYLESAVMKYREVPADERVFPYYSDNDTQLLKLHVLVYAGNFSQFCMEFKQFCLKLNLNDQDILSILWRIKEWLFRNHSYEYARNFLDHIISDQFISKNTYITENLGYPIISFEEWVNFNVTYAQTLSDNSSMNEALNHFDMILKHINKTQGLSRTYISVLNSKAFEAVKHHDYTLAKDLYEKAESIYYQLKDNDQLEHYNTVCGLIACYCELGNYVEALDLSYKLIDMLSKLRSTTNDDSTYFIELCLAYWRQGQALSHLQRHQEADEILSQAYQIVIDHEIVGHNRDFIANELVLLYKRQIEETNDARIIEQLFLKACQILNENTHLENTYISFFEDEELLSRVFSVTTSGEIIDTYIRTVKEIYTHALANGIITEETFETASDFKQLTCLAYLYKRLGNYDMAVELFNQAMSITNDPLNISEAYSNLSYLYQFEKVDIIKSLQYRILSCQQLIDRLGVNSSITKEQIYMTYLVMLNSIAGSSRYQLMHINDAQHPHFSYEENMELVSLMTSFLLELKENYGMEYLDELNRHFIESQNRYSQETLGKDAILSTESKIDPLARCYYERVLLDIAFDRMDNLGETYPAFTSFLNENYSHVDDIRFDLMIKISKALFAEGYYNHATDLLLANFKENIKYNEIIITKLCHMADQVGNQQMLINLLYLYPYLIHDDMVGFDYYKTYWNINNLIDQLILLYRNLSGLDDNKAEDFLNILKKLIEFDCVGQNGEHIDKAIIATIYNDLGCKATTIAEKIDYFEKASKAADKDIIIKTNLASSYIDNHQYNKADSLLAISLEYIRHNYLSNRNESFIYETKLMNNLYMKKPGETKYYARKVLLNAIDDFKTNSKTMTSIEVANYWNKYYSSLMHFVTTADATLGHDASNAYDAALFQKGVLLRNRNFRKNNILNSQDTLLINLYNKYCYELQHNSDSVAIYESQMMYRYSLHPEFMKGEITPSWKDVQAKLGKNDLAIEFSSMIDYQDETQYYVALLLDNRMQTPRLIKMCKCDELHGIMQRYGPNAYEEYIEDTNVLYSLIWASLEPYLKRYKNIYVSPHHQLSFINFECISEKKNGRRMDELYNIRRVSTTGNICKENFNIESLVLYGGIDYEHSAMLNVDYTPNTNSPNEEYSELRGYKENWESLTFTLDEINFICDQYNKELIPTISYNGDKATEESFKSLSGNQSSVIHLATHGYYFTVNEAREEEYFNSTNIDTDYIDKSGVRSGLLFSGANIAWSGVSLPEGVEDGILTSDEVMGMDLSNTDLLVLSACQSGLGDLESDGAYGLQRCFKIAGVNTILMSLWKVHDYATSYMMQMFYKNLLKGKNKKDAFLAAQNDLRKSKEYSDPYYWAAFIMLD